MKTQHYRPAVTNGQINQRRTRPVASAVRPARRKTNSSSTSQGKAGGGRGSRILGVMLMLGLLLTGGFLLGIHSQISALHLNQAEESLKTELDRTANEQKYLDLEQRRALNLTDSERASREAGLVPLNLDRRSQSYRLIPASYARPAAAAVSDVDEESSATTKPSARPKAPQAKATRPAELKAAKAALPTAKIAAKPAGKLAAKAATGPGAKAANNPLPKVATKIAAKPVTAKAGKSASLPQSKSANKAVAKLVVAKLAKADASKGVQARRAR